MIQLKPYLVFNGNCEEAFLFYKTVFQSEFTYIGRFNEMPNENVPQLSDIDGNKIMHVTLPIGATELMGSDTHSQSGDVIIGSNISISINAQSREEADRLFNGLSADGILKMPMEDTFWNAYFGMLTDKFGIHWMVNFDVI